MRLRLYVIAALIGFAAPAVAQRYDPNYPVCMEVYGGRLTAEYIDCSFTSIPQCQATASGRSASCTENPFYAGPKTPPKGRPHRHRHRAD